MASAQRSVRSRSPLRLPVFSGLRRTVSWQWMTRCYQAFTRAGARTPQPRKVSNSGGGYVVISWRYADERTIRCGLPNGSATSSQGHQDHQILATAGCPAFELSSCHRDHRCISDVSFLLLVLMSQIDSVPYAFQMGSIPLLPIYRGDHFRSATKPGRDRAQGLRNNFQVEAPPSTGPVFVQIDIPHREYGTPCYFDDIHRGSTKSKPTAIRS